MLLVGKTHSRGDTAEKGPLDAILVVNPESHRLKLSHGALKFTKLGGKFLGVAYPEPKDEDKNIYLYGTEDEKTGFKVSLKGEVNSKAHALMLKGIFSPEEDGIFRLRLDTTPVVKDDYPEYQFYKLSAVEEEQK